VLTHLVNEVSQYVDRTAMFIVKGPSAIGWYARGVEPADVIKQVNVPLNADTVLRNVNNSRHAMRGAMEHSPGTQQALAKLGGNPQAVLAVPLILRDKLAAILYCDTSMEEVPPPVADLIEVLVLFAGKTIDMLSLAPKAAAAPAAPAPSAPSRPPAPAPRPAAAAAAPQPADEGGSTVMFNAQQMNALRPGGASPRAAAAPPPPPAAHAPAMSPEETKAHEDAKRFARLVVSEIKLYNEAKVNEGRRNKDIYERLKEDIERGRQMYADRVAPHVRDSTNYFYDELVRILAGGDQGALGPM
jgi:pyruvate/2-oxoglutarate dehydrogenase complex dihydrolipoamide acyltransferase (E2) component